MPTYKIYIAGKFTATKTELIVYNPYDQTQVATTYLAGKEELELAIEKGLSVEKEMKEMPVFKRYAILMQIANELKKNKEHLAFILSQESGKPMRYAIGEIERASQTFIIAAEEAKRIPNEYISIDWTASGQGKEAVIKYFPLGK